MWTSLRRTSWTGIAIAVVLNAVTSGSACAQVSDAVDDALQRAIQSRQAGQTPYSDQLRPSVQVYQPVIPEQAQIAPPSRLEALYSARAARPLEQFGYDVLGVPSPVSVVQAGTVQDNYVLGEGDEIVVVLRGQENITYRERVNRDGQVILPRLEPLPAAGRSFGDFRASLESRIAQVYISTSAFVTLGELRQISVLITGEVRAPGQRILNALATPLDAILLSGGIAKTGSLRNVALIRGNSTTSIDLYAILTRGSLPDIGGLRNGDRIYVPPLHDTVAVTGYVRRPGIYELRDGQKTLGARDLIELAGGIEIAGKYRLSKTRLEPNGSTRLVSLSEGNPGPVANGEVLFVDMDYDAALERVTLAGAVRLEGKYPLATASSVRSLIRSSSELACDAYTPFAVIVRRDPILNARTLVPFSLVSLLSDGADIRLQNEDVVYIFSRNEIRLLGDVATNQQAARLRPGTLAPEAPGTLEPTDFSDGPFGMTPGCNDFRVQSSPQPPVPDYGMAAQPANPINQPFLPSPQATSPVTNFPGTNFPVTNYPNQPFLQGPQSSAQQNPGLPQPPGIQQFRTFPQAPGLQQLQNVPTSPNTRQNSNTPQYSGPPQSQGTAPYPGIPQAFPPGTIPVRPLSVDTIAAGMGVPVEPLVRMAADHVIWVLDKVRDPGAYVAGDGTTLADMIETAGGASRLADLSSVEVTSTKIDAQSGSSETERKTYKGTLQDLRRVLLQPLDVIRLRPVFSDRQDGRITLLGEVHYPGTLDITRGERLSSVLERVGGLTGQAYPYGAVFTRVRAAVAERDANTRTARELEGQLATLVTLTTTETTPGSQNTIAFLSGLAQRLRDAPVIGRITATVDPNVLRMKPELDFILEPGDTIYIPARPSTVTISGEVLNPGSFEYNADLTVRDYIRLAGGETQAADNGRVFVVFPDGTAQPVRESWLSFGNSARIPPGSTVVVPRDLRPFQLSQFLRDATQITSQLAITAASFAVINR